MAAKDRWPGGQPCPPDSGGHQATAIPDLGRDHGMRRERTSADESPPAQSALVVGSRRHRRVDRHSVAGDFGRGRHRTQRGGNLVHRTGPRGAGKRGPVLSAQPLHRRGHPRRDVARLRNERRGPPAPARLSSPADRPWMVRNDQRQVAGPY